MQVKSLLKAGYKMDFTGKHILILGMGLSGRQACRLALKNGAQVILVDSRPEELMKSQLDEILLSNESIKFIFEAQKCSLKSLENHFDYIVISPGILPKSELGQFAQSYNCPVLSELDFASAFIKTPLITITGTNGKTTSVELLTHLLKEAKYKVESAGNIGLALSDIAYDEQYQDLDFVIVEASSYQLENLYFYKSAASALLNISSDHCDRYENETEYFLTKMKLSAVTEAHKFFIGKTVLQRQDLPEELRAKAQVINSLSAEKISHLNASPAMLAPHNLENLATALSLAESLGIDKSKVLNGLSTFKLSPHRIEQFGDKAGRTFIDDSKATNPDAVLQALKSFPSYEGKIRLILGGVSKDMDFSSLPKGFSVLKKNLLLRTRR